MQMLNAASGAVPCPWASCTRMEPRPLQAMMVWVCQPLSWALLGPAPGNSPGLQSAAPRWHQLLMSLLWWVRLYCLRRAALDLLRATTTSAGCSIVQEPTAKVFLTKSLAKICAAEDRASSRGATALAGKVEWVKSTPQGAAGGSAKRQNRGSRKSNR